MTITDPTNETSDPHQYWTLVNITEAVPHVLTPMCWSFWRDYAVPGIWHGVADTGVIPRKRAVSRKKPDQRLIAAFYGRPAFNVDLICEFAGAMPGTSPRAVERHLFGHVRPEPPAPQRHPLMPILIKSSIVLARQTRRARKLHRDTLTWWVREVYSPLSPHDPQQLLREACYRASTVMRRHSVTRAFTDAATTALDKLAGLAERTNLLPALKSGVGGLEETALAGDLWLLAHLQLTRHEFLRRHGFHATSEGNVYGTSWREDPRAIDGIIEAYSRQTRDQSPQFHCEQTRKRHITARQALLAATPRSRRLLTRIVLRNVASRTRELELTKASFAMTLDAARAAIRAIGAQHAHNGVLDKPDDAFFLTIDELAGPLPTHTRRIVAHRRARHAMYQRLELPLTFAGIPAADQTTSLDDVVPSDLIRGLGASPGSTEGEVRFVTDPTAPPPPGTIVVCHLTDPSWTPLIGLAAGLIVDVGTPASHAAIIARELGIPCVIGTRDGSARLRTGDKVRLDGSTGHVTILTRATRGLTAETPS